MGDVVYIDEQDGAGGPVTLETANKAVETLAELWGGGLFDCSPQDYAFMKMEILRNFHDKS